MSLFGRVPATAVADKIKSFSTLSQGWHHGEGSPIDQAIVDLGLEFLDYSLSQNLLADAVPGLDGDLQIAVYPDLEEKKSYLEITILYKGHFNITRYRLGGGRWIVDEDRDIVLKSDVLIHIQEYGREHDIWRSSLESYLKDISTKNSADLAAKPLKTIGVQYPLYATSACVIHPQLNVTTSIIFTSRSTRLLSSIGDSITQSSPTDAIGFRKIVSPGTNAITTF